VVVAAALVIGGVIGRKQAELDANLPSADTPPAEYLYLDTARVLAYLGQVEGGLSKEEKRTLGVSQKTSAQLTGGKVAELSAEVNSQIASEQTVAPTVADRFYRFLRLMRVDRRDDRPPSLTHDGRWLNDLDAPVSGANTPQSVRQKVLTPLEEGEFIRIRVARLCAPAYVGVLRKLAYLPGCTASSNRPGTPPRTAASRSERKATKAYARRLPKGTLIPLMAKTRRADRAGQPRQAITFLLPTPYSGLTPNAALLANPVTIVGKVVYKDIRLKKPSTDVRPLRYIDRSTVSTFTPLLKHSSDELLKRARLSRGHLKVKVKRSVTIRTPVVVLLPVAIYD
jgi:hypothetical protein